VSSPVLEVDRLKVHYLARSGARVQAVAGVSFSLREGEILGIAGESGCGKTTLVSACMGLYLPPLYRTSGDVRIDGQSIVGMSVEENRKDVLGRRVALIPQGALNSLNPTRKVGDLAADMILSHDATADRKEVHARLRDRFRRLGLDAERVLAAYPSALPGGMKQRVVIGISTLLNPRVVIADEPTSALDVTTQKAVIQLLFDLMDEGIVGSMLFVTHELPLLRHVATSIAVMYAGEFVEYGETNDVIFDPRHPYSKALMGAMISPEPGQRGRRPVAIEGAPPNLGRELVGCRFAERCPSVRPGCEAQAQELRVLRRREVRCQHAQ
jgi:peptide/nickel transport system ATP-binding protein